MKPRSLWSELRIGAIAIAGISLLGVAGFAAMHGEHDAGVYETRPKLPAAATAGMFSVPLPATSNGSPRRSDQSESSPLS